MIKFDGGTVVKEEKLGLIDEIELKKKDMYVKAQLYGFTDPRVVAHSQELDILINKYLGISA
ncbi:aspartyl-phosphate phosphatase Spo0E family protein [Chungangia koreensis]|uniref:aspartyl-phosphate phosphatase Spo0E family protein n=1 Tax=Chungangia koreensis TaxID=752657 RepID=UPI00366AC3E8